MKRIIIFFLFVMLISSCAITPNIPNFPDAPKELITQCPELILVADGETRLSETLKVVVENYGLYHECQLKNDLWIQWYDNQKKIYE